MALTKKEKIASIEEQIAQLKNQQKLLKQQHNEQERKDRTKRLCRRMGLFESLLPETIPLTDDLFKTFLEKTILSEYAKKILREVTAQNAAPPTPTGAGTAAKPVTPIATKTAATERGNDGGENGDGGTAQG